MADDEKFPATKILLPRKYSSDIDIEEYVAISADVNSEFIKQSSRYAIVATNYARAKYLSRMRKKDLELTAARLGDLIRKKGELHEKKFTRDEVNAKVIQHGDYQVALKEYNEALYREDLLRGFVDAMDEKKDCLVSYGANMRQEMQPELRILADELARKRGTKNG